MGKHSHRDTCEHLCGLWKPSLLSKRIEIEEADDIRQQSCSGYWFQHLSIFKHLGLMQTLRVCLTSSCSLPCFLMILWENKSIEHANLNQEDSFKSNPNYQLHCEVCLVVFASVQWRMLAQIMKQQSGNWQAQSGRRDGHSLLRNVCRGLRGVSKRYIHTFHSKICSKIYIPCGNVSLLSLIPPCCYAMQWWWRLDRVRPGSFTACSWTALLNWFLPRG